MAGSASANSVPILFARAALIGVLFVYVAPAHAQFGRTTDSGMFGGRTLGGGTSGGGRSLTSTPGDYGGVGRGLGGQGSGSLGGMAQGGDAGSLSGNERFLRNNRQGQFVGRDMAEVTTNFVGQDSQGLSSGAQNLGLLRALTTLNPNANSGRASERRPVPVAYRVAFPHRQPAQADVVRRVSTRLQKQFTEKDMGTIELLAGEDAIILRGTVATEHDRDLAQQLVALEPGVGPIRNELEVALPKQQESIPAPSPDLNSPVTE